MSTNISSDSPNDIFIKNTDKEIIYLSKDIMKSIPENALKEPDSELVKNKTEWRWRLFKFPDRDNKIMEISYNKPNEKRMYIDKYGKWINSEIGNEFDKFVTDQYYTYT